MTTSKATYKLHYFPVRSRAEGIRYIFHYAGVPFEDIRYTPEQWKSRDLKAPFEKFLYGQMPVLEITDESGTWFLSQSTTIARFLAHRFGLTGENDKEAALCDEVVAGLDEAFSQAAPQFYTNDEEVKKKAFERLKSNEYPRCLGALEKRLKDNGGEFMVGKKLTWADISVSWFVRGCQDYAKPVASELEKYTNLLQLCNRVESISTIASYIKTRPETQV